MATKKSKKSKASKRSKPAKKLGSAGRKGAKAGPKKRPRRTAERGTSKKRGSTKATGARTRIAGAGRMVAVGMPAPEFTLPSDVGGDVSLASLRGKKVVLYFYPKDDTPGCTVQACDFRDATPSFAGVHAVVLGVSADSVASHRKFRDKFGLNFPLLADEDHAVCEAYGVWTEKSLYGRTFMGIERSTFLIDESGIIAGVWRKVQAKGHADMLAELLGAA